MFVHVTDGKTNQDTSIKSGSHVICDCDCAHRTADGHTSRQVIPFHLEDTCFFIVFLTTLKRIEKVKKTKKKLKVKKIHL